MALINMRCKQSRLGDSIYEYNSDRPTSSCQWAKDKKREIKERVREREREIERGIVKVWDIKTECIKVKNHCLDHLNCIFDLNLKKYSNYLFLQLFLGKSIITYGLYTTLVFIEVYKKHLKRSLKWKSIIRNAWAVTHSRPPVVFYSLHVRKDIVHN